MDELVLSQLRRIRNWNASHPGTSATLVTISVFALGTVLLFRYLFPTGFTLESLSLLAQTPAKVSLVIALLVASLMGGDVAARAAQDTRSHQVETAHVQLVGSLGPDYTDRITTAVADTEGMLTDLATLTREDKSQDRIIADLKAQLLQTSQETAILRTAVSQLEQRLAALEAAQSESQNRTPSSKE